MDDGDRIAMKMKWNTRRNKERREKERNLDCWKSCLTVKTEFVDISEWNDAFGDGP